MFPTPIAQDAVGSPRRSWQPKAQLAASILLAANCGKIEAANCGKMRLPTAEKLRLLTAEKIEAANGGKKLRLPTAENAIGSLKSE